MCVCWFLFSTIYNAVEDKIKLKCHTFAPRAWKGLSGFRTQSSPAAISASQRASLYAGKRCVCVQLTSFRPPWVYQLQFTPDNFRGQPSKQPRAKLIPFGQHDIYLNGFIWIILHNLLYISLYSSLQATLYFLFSSCLQFTKCHFVYFCCLSLPCRH